MITEYGVEVVVIVELWLLCQVIDVFGDRQTVSTCVGPLHLDLTSRAENFLI